MNEYGIVPDFEHVEAGFFPNPLLRHFRLIDEKPDCLRLMGEALPLVDFLCLEQDSDWWFYGSSLTIGKTVVTAWTAKPMRLLFSRQGQLIALIGYGGVQRFRQASKTWTCNKDSCLLMASDTCSMETSLSSAVAFSLSQERLLHTAITMGGMSRKPRGWKRILAQAHGWTKPSDPGAPCLQAALRQVIATAGQLSGYSQALLERLQLDDQIYRLVAAMLLPELQQQNCIDRLLQRQRQGRDAFDALIDYIKDHLAEPLTLSDLESRSSYSRRALQYAFVKRMGCTASQWIRNQRLDMARRRLENPDPSDSVGSISRECGYRSLSLFSVDFQQHFHIKPSQLLREARAAIAEARQDHGTPLPDR